MQRSVPAKAEVAAKVPPASPVPARVASQAAEPVIRFLPARRKRLADIAGIEIPRGMDIDELASEFAPREE